ncbi:MAG: DUF669 domain-containing protein [Oscillospiraceae bacterium]
MNEDFKEFGWEDEIVNEEQYVMLPEGDYDFTVEKVERGRHNGSEKMPPCNKAIVTITVWGPEDKVNIVENFMLCNKLEWKLSQFFLSIGLKKHGEPLRMNWNAVTGKKGKCHVYVDNYKDKNGNDRQSNKIRKFYAYDEDVTTIQPNNTAAQNNFSGFNQQPAQSGFGNWNGGSMR